MSVRVKEILAEATRAAAQASTATHLIGAIEALSQEVDKVVWESRDIAQRVVAAHVEHHPHVASPAAPVTSVDVEALRAALVAFEGQP